MPLPIRLTVRLEARAEDQGAGGQHLLVAEALLVLVGGGDQRRQQVVAGVPAQVPEVATEPAVELGEVALDAAVGPPVHPDVQARRGAVAPGEELLAHPHRDAAASPR